MLQGKKRLSRKREKESTEREREKEERKTERERESSGKAWGERMRRRKQNWLKINHASLNGL